MIQQLHLLTPFIFRFPQNEFACWQKQERYRRTASPHTWVVLQAEAAQVTVATEVKGQKVKKSTKASLQ